jgi:hypothetical protein
MIKDGAADKRVVTQPIACVGRAGSQNPPIRDKMTCEIIIGRLGVVVAVWDVIRTLTPKPRNLYFQRRVLILEGLPVGRQACRNGKAKSNNLDKFTDGRPTHRKGTRTSCDVNALEGDNTKTDFEYFYDGNSHINPVTQCDDRFFDERWRDVFANALIKMHLRCFSLMNCQLRREDNFPDRFRRAVTIEISVNQDKPSNRHREGRRPVAIHVLAVDALTSGLPRRFAPRNDKYSCASCSREKSISSPAIPAEVSRTAL